ncbi:MAG: phosphatase PAP2 family protein [Chloroflexota bacterium]
MTRDATRGPSITTRKIEPPTAPTRRGVTSLAVGFVIALVAMLCFAFIADRIYDREAFALDAVANPFLHAISSPALDVVMNGITTLGSVPFVGVVFVVAMVILLARDKRADALFLAVAIGGSVALNSALKLLIERPRPMLPWAHVLPDYSFPSGHSMNSLVFYLALAVLTWINVGRRAGGVAVIVALVIAIAVGFSRIYLGYHYLSDVVGGFAAGLAWLFIVSIAFETIPNAWARRPWPIHHNRTST